MKKALILAKKELAGFSNAPAFYGAAVFFVLFCSIWLFYLQRFFTMNTASLRSYFAAFPVAYILVVPVITMKSWAEERKLGSMELLLTMPFSEWDLVLGKFISCLAAVAALLVLTLPVPLLIVPLGRFDIGVIVCEYAGALLLGGLCCALGLFLSCVSKNQAGAFLGTAAVLLITILITNFAAALNLPQAIAEGINFLSLSFHFESFSKGILDTRDIIFFIAGAALFLFLNTRAILARKWR